MTRRGLFLALALAAGAFAAWSGGPAQAEGEEVRLGTTPESYPPFSWVDSEGKLHGFEIELSEAICAEAKLKCTWVLQAWDGIIPALQENKFDAIAASMSITAERKQIVDFSDFYYNTPAWFVGRKDQTIEITPEGLKGKVIGVQVSTIHYNYVEAKFKDVVEIKTYDTQENANLDLIAGRVDLLLADSITLNDALLSKPEGADFEQKGPPVVDPIMGDGVGFALRKGDEALRGKLNAAIHTIRANGVYKTINDKYFTFDVYGAK